MVRMMLPIVVLFAAMTASTAASAQNAAGTIVMKGTFPAKGTANRWRMDSVIRLSVDNLVRYTTEEQEWGRATLNGAAGHAQFMSPQTCNGIETGQFPKFTTTQVSFTGTTLRLRMSVEGKSPDPCTGKGSWVTAGSLEYDIDMSGNHCKFQYRFSVSGKHLKHGRINVSVADSCAFDGFFAQVARGGGQPPIPPPAQARPAPPAEQPRGLQSLFERGGTPAAPAPAGPPDKGLGGIGGDETPVADCSRAETHWKVADEIKTVKIYEDHLARFASCEFAELARARIEALKK